MAVVKVIELIGTSKKSWEDALQQIVKEASESIRHVTGVDLVHQTAHVDNGKITEYRTTARVAFRVETGGDMGGTGRKRK